jgi:hypothetical protein
MFLSRAMTIAIAVIVTSISIARAETSYDQVLANFKFPADLCGQPEFVTSNMTNDDVARINAHNTAWQDCQASMQDADTSALRRLITGALGGQWQPVGDNFAWDVTADCACKDQVRTLWQERANRSVRRLRANDALMADIAMAQQRLATGD